jgi:hypothetical protein
MWQLGVLASRVSAMLAYLGVEDRGPSEVLLDRAGRAAAVFLAGSRFSRATTTASGPDAVELTSEGLALAADLGLLVARELVRLRPELRWVVLRKPRGAAAFNLPVLVAHSGAFFEPLRPSIANAHAVVAGMRRPDVWARMLTERLRNSAPPVNGD